MFFGIILVIIGIIFLLGNLGLISNVSWSIIGPILLIALGLSLIFRRRNYGPRLQKRETASGTLKQNAENAENPK